MKRVLLIALVILLLVMAGIAGGALYLLNSRDGLSRALAWSAAWLPGELSVATVQGRLRGPIRLQGLRYTDEQRQVRLDHLELAWRPAALLDRTLHIENLSLRGLDIVQTEETPGGEAADLQLPIGIIIERLDAEALSYQGADQAPRRIDRIALNARLERATLIVAAFELQTPQGELHVSGSLQTAGRHRIDLDTTWRLALPEQPELRGAGTVHGTLNRLSTAQTLQAPIALTVTATLNNGWSKNPRWTLESATEHLDPSPWAEALTTPLRDVTLRLQGDTTDYQGEVGLGYALPELGLVRLQTRLAGSATELRLSDLRLTPANHNLRARMDAQLDLTAQPWSATINGRWQDLQWPLEGAAQIASPRGEFELSGHGDDYRFVVKAPVQRPDLSLGDWELSGRGNRDGINLERLAGRIAHGTLDGSGKLSWRDGLRWETRLSAAQIDPAVYAAEWPGNLQAEIAASGTVEQGRPLANITLESLSGTLRGYPVTASAQAQLTPAGVHLRNARLQSGTARVALDGRIAEQLDLTFQVEAEALRELLPVQNGSAKASGRLRGTRDAPRLDATLRLTDLTLEGTRVSRVQGDISADLAAGGTVTARLVADTLERGEQSLDQITVTAQGRTEDHRVQLDARGARTDLTLALRGGYREQRWQGELTQGRWQQPILGTWSLAQPVVLAFGADVAQVASHCWRRPVIGAPSELCLAADWAQTGSWQVSGTLNQLPLSFLNPLLPGGALLDGPLDGRFQVRQSAQGSVSGNAQLALGAGTLHPGQTAVQAQPLAHTGGNVELTLADERLNGTLALALAGGGTLSGRAQLKPFDPRRPAAAQTALSGELQLSLPDLSLLATLLPRLAIGPGSAQAALRLGGHIDAPQLRGSATLTAEHVEVGAAGIRLKALRIAAESDDGRTWQLTGKTTSGAGELTVQGSTALDPARGWPTRLRVRGERFEAVNLRDYWALVSPDLTLTLERQRLSVEGELRVPEAQIRPRRGGSEAVAVSRDTVIVGAESEAEPSRLLGLFARIKLILGDKVQFTGFGLSSRITGQLTVEDAPDSVVKGNGELRVVKGEYKSYGQDLTVESGRLTFAGGPIDNPGIDARAVRYSGDVTTGILLRGTLRNPQITLFSNPSMPQADILSYLVLGVPVSQADQQSGGSSLLATAAALGYVADSPLVRQLRRGLGIEELRIESDTTRESVAVVLGRYLSPRLYVSYSVGLTENESAFRMRYKLGKNWTLETESGTQSGADLQYVIEK